MNLQKRYGEGVELLWKDRKRFCGLPLSFTRYRLVKKPGQWTKIISNVGLLYSVIDEVNIYRICDLTLRQSLMGKLFNTGSVTLISSDESKPTFVLRNIKNPFQVRDMFSNLIEEQRKLNRVGVIETHSHA